ncbi:glutamate-1-semialdehyde 2,1-aminomutase [Caldalkalibacillus uzonensis]|uniref:Glutamate-1-semialdehyde 2,1-aminomutase n=1 Tax=Caldalkalibacillus uzonensis TaxID=353224 RepID=A0ABU0CS47_9BACI|nr:aspartate aminotransferase family protein [Caldalkalibacillus uzonensis]MDQ0339246.1 glutamate-1-semialdehyde 2,1-aminomutase [Caldalkalibacillus uzonensis]
MAIVAHQDPLQLLKNRTKKSYQLFQEAQQVMPGGVTANIKYFDPYPIMMAEAEGSRLKDVDGNEYVDYLLAYGALILGHGHHKVTNAVIRQMVTKGTTIFGTPHELEVEMAKRLVKLYPGVEQVRYTNSGTEATLLAIRLAHAYTGKSKIAKFEGHYHGGYDQVLLSINPPLDQAGPADAPVAVPDSAGIDVYYQEHTIILPFNDLEATADILKARKEELAAVVVEPVQAGFIPATESFMQGLRKLTEELGILLIFDEVKTCFRVALGGAQSLYGIKPDLTALGKVLGGGFPVGAVGGKKEIMDVASPHGKKDVFEMNVKSKKKDVLFHSGTYNGHPSVLAAGLATLDVLEEGDNFETIVRTTEKLRRGLENVLRYYQIPVQTLGLGTIFNLVMTTEPITNYRDLQNANLDLRRQLDYYLLTLGVYTKPLNRYSLSLAHSDREIQETIDAYEAAAKQLLVKRGSQLNQD